MSKNKLTKSQAISKFIERTKITKRISFALSDLEDIFGDSDFLFMKENDEMYLDWYLIEDYLEELIDVEEVDFEIYREEYNEVDTIPENLEKLINLKRINLPFQYIEDIPYNLHNLKNINYFNIAGNYLTEFPKFLFNLPKLETIGIVKNNFSIIDIFYEITGIETQQNPYKYISTVLNETLSAIYKYIVKFYYGSNNYEIIWPENKD